MHYSHSEATVSYFIYLCFTQYIKDTGVRFVGLEITITYPFSKLVHVSQPEGMEHLKLKKNCWSKSTTSRPGQSSEHGGSGIGPIWQNLVSTYRFTIVARSLNGAERDDLGRDWRTWNSLVPIESNL